MAKTYADSVKLPNLVSVAHPLTKFSPKCSLNVEGKNSSMENSYSSFGSRNFDRKSYIASILDSDEIKSKSFGDRMHTSSDQVFDMINEKLNTGYHGVKHLFMSNDLNKTGRLSRESFKWVLSQLCGCLSNDTWNKIMFKFKLNENETISFDEFISFFDSNQKVRKELVASSKSVQLINFKSSSMISLLSQRDMSKKVVVPELSAAYCLSIIKSKANIRNFDPKNYLPEECFTKNIILPHHLKNMIALMELKISGTEFQKLWTKFDMKNTGCCRTQLFLRLINYKSVDEQNKFEYLRSKTCIVDKLDFNSTFGKKQNSFLNLNRNFKSQTFVEDEKKSEIIDNVKESKVEAENEPDKEIKLVEETKPVEIKTPKDDVEIVDEHQDEEIESKQEDKFENSKEEENKRESSIQRVSSSQSEIRIKSMVHNLKKSNEFGPNNDLISYLNNKINEGFIVLRTAFEYIDQDSLGHLLTYEFRTVLDEFKIYTDSKLLNKFLKNHGLLKSDQIVDYNRFLQVFQDRSPLGLYRQYLLHGSDGKLEDQILDFFHQNYTSVQNYFKDSLEESTCTLDQLKKLIEQKFTIIVSDNQYKSLLEFLNVEPLNLKINWDILFKKFSDIDPWKMFKENYEKVSKSRKSSSIRFSRSKSLLNLNTKSEKIAEIDEKPILERDSDSESDKNIHSDDELFASIANISKKWEVDKKPKFSDFSKNLKDELRVIKKLEKKVEAIIRLQFHSLSKFFSVLDPDHTEKIDKEKFRLLMEKCGAKFTQDQIDLVWKDFNANTIPFSNFVRRFFIPEEFNHLREIRHKIKLEKYIEENKNNELFTPRSNLTCYSQPEFKTGKQKKINKKGNLIEIARPVVAENWNNIKNDFKREDKLAKTLVTYATAYEILKSYKIPLSEDELEEMCADFHSNGTNFDYVKFLRFFKNDKSDLKTSIRNSLNPVLLELVTKLREKHIDQNKSNTINDHDISNLRNVFKKYDASKRGFLKQSEFKKLLAYCELKPTSDHMFMILCEYDPELKGIFNYELFIQSLIEKMLN